MSVQATQQVMQMVDELALPEGQFFVGGSGVLAMHGIRPIGSDLDLGVTTRLWSDLYIGGLLSNDRAWRMFTPDPEDDKRRCDPPYIYRPVQGVQVHAFFAWCLRDHYVTRFNDYNRVFREGLEDVRGVPCIRLEILLQQKLDAASSGTPRPKDLRDIGLISSYLEERDAAEHR